jgi:diguanylate cyclase (GGDEF)-like protein
MEALVADPHSGDDLAGKQTLADAEQTLADTDQTLADADQTGSDSDQASSDSDRRAAERDQAASDHDLAHGVDPRLHEFSRDVRERSARRREQTATARLETAHQRDTAAGARDLAALARDQAAAARDLAMAQHARADEHVVGLRVVRGADIVLRAADQRRRAARYRAEAAEHRALAAEDRLAAQQDREQAALDRRHALSDHEALARQLAIAETDALTGARTRAAGLRDLDHELDRCRRNKGALVVAYVDVVGLKALNDTQGHGAGDDLLKRVVAQIRTQLRSYDLIVRIGGDEFLVAMSNITLPDARGRFAQVAGTLAASEKPGAIRAGLAELAGDDSADDLIARADSELTAKHG